MNLVVALIVLGGSAFAAWSGLTDPEGGPLGAFGRALRGEPQPARKTPPTAASLIGSAGGLAGSTGSSGPGGDAGVSGPIVGRRAAVVDAARARLGRPYKLGGNGPEYYDCSGLTVACMKAAGKNLPRTAAQQQMSPQGVNVAVASVQPGDLIFYGFPATHVAIAIGNGQVIHAPRPGKKVQIATIANAGYPQKPNNARDFLSTPLS